ncbi:class I SAM-dependent methyltransferase [Bacillus sp. SL00103]
MIYQGFAGVYDELMTHAPYDEWVQWIQQNIKPNAAIIDVGCGTGEIALRLAEKGHAVTGIDPAKKCSPSRSKSTGEKTVHSIFTSRYERADGFEQVFQVAVICCDSLNYLKNENDVKKTFKNMFQLLEEDGVLLFDVHTPYKMEEVFPGSTYADQDDEISYIWQSDKGDDMYSVIHDLSFFCKGWRCVSAL